MFLCETEEKEKTVKERKMVEILIRKQRWNVYIFRNLLKLASENVVWVK